MAWTTPGTAIVGQLLTASYWNAQVRDNLAYLHGDAGTAISLNNGIVVLNAANPAIQYFYNGESNQKWYIENGTGRTIMGPGGATAVDTYAMSRLAAGVVGGGLVSASEIMAYHRHPYGNRRHLESGQVTATSLASMATTNASVTFTDAFAVVSAITTGVFSSGDNGTNTPNGSISGGCWLSATSTTGFTLYMRNMSNGTLTLVFHWIAEGTD